MSEVIEVDEQGVLAIPADAIGNPKPHSRYVLDVQGNGVLLQPADLAAPAGKALPNGIMARWEALAQEVNRAWRSDLSAEQTLSGMRR